MSSTGLLHLASDEALAFYLHLQEKIPVARFAKLNKDTSDAFIYRDRIKEPKKTHSSLQALLRSVLLN
jgi:hypothetical protein